MERDIIFAIAAVVGAIVGNWLVVPLLFGKRTRKDSIAIGKITAILVLFVIVVVVLLNGIQK